MLSESAVIALIISYASIFGVDKNVALAVAKQESNYKVLAMSKDKKDHGIFQLRKSSYPHLSKKELLNPYTNVMLGIMYLKKAKEKCIHTKHLEWLTCYNAGPTGAKRIKYPSKFKYVRIITKAVSERKFHE